MEDILVPISVFGAMVLIFWFGFNASTRKREAELETVRSVVEKTGELSTDLVQAIGRPHQHKNPDLRKGLILIAIAVAFASLGQLVPDDQATGPMLGVALFPGLVGLVYVLFHFMGGGND